MPCWLLHCHSTMTSKQDTVAIQLQPDYQIQKSDDISGGVKGGTTEQVPRLLCLPLAPLPPPLRFLLCTAAIFFFYVLYGYMLELVFRTEGIKEHGWFITLVQFCYYTTFAFLQLLFSRQTIRTSVPLGTYGLIALLTVGTMGFSNTSMGYLNYPTQVVFKSCKLIPVMLGSMVILHKRYNLPEVLSCALMCAGLVWFTLVDAQLQPNFNSTGVVLVCLSLCCDAVIGPVQEAALKRHREASARFVLYSYGLGVLLITVLLLLAGKLLDGAVFYVEHWASLSPTVALLSLCGFCGVQGVLTLVALYGALTAVTVTTARKALSIVLSFFAFTKPFTIQYLLAGLVVAAGVYLNLFSRQQRGPVAALARLPRRCCPLATTPAPDSSTPSSQTRCGLSGRLHLRPAILRLAGLLRGGRRLPYDKFNV